jgi:lipopolysaccharide biosynthesis regulator YciM
MDKILTLLEYLKEDPNDTFSRYALALEYVKSNQDDVAAIHFAHLNQEHPEYLAAYYHYGKLMVRRGEPEQAGKIFTAGLEVAKKSGDRHTFNELAGALEELY